MAEYYYQDSDKWLGPFTGNEIKQMALNGVITPETIIRMEDGLNSPAKNIKALIFGAPQKNQTPLPPPLPQQTSLVSQRNPFSSFLEILVAIQIGIFATMQTLFGMSYLFRQAILITLFFTGIIAILRAADKKFQQISIGGVFVVLTWLVIENTVASFSFIFAPYPIQIENAFNPNNHSFLKTEYANRDDNPDYTPCGTISFSDLFSDMQAWTASWNSFEKQGHSKRDVKYFASTIPNDLITPEVIQFELESLSFYELPNDFASSSMAIFTIKKRSNFKFIQIHSIELIVHDYIPLEKPLRTYYGACAPAEPVVPQMPSLIKIPPIVTAHLISKKNEPLPWRFDAGFISDTITTINLKTETAAIDHDYYQKIWVRIGSLSPGFYNISYRIKISTDRDGIYDIPLSKEKFWVGFYKERFDNIEDNNENGL